MSDTDQTSQDTSADQQQQGPQGAMALVKQAYATVFGNFGDMVKMVWLVMVLHLLHGFYQMQRVSDALSGGYRVNAGSLNFNLSWGVGGVIEALLAWLLLSAVGVAVLRYVLVGQKPGFPGFGIGKRELRLFGYGLAWYGLMVLVVVVPALLMIGGSKLLLGTFGTTGGMWEILQIVLFVAIAVVYVVTAIRLAFVFPALAEDREGGLKHRFTAAWRLAKGHTWTMALAILLAFLPWWLVSIVISSLWGMDMALATLQGQPLSGGMLAVTLVSLVFSWIMFLLGVTLYAHAYRVLCETPPTPALDEA